MKVGFLKIFVDPLVKYPICERASWIHKKYFGLIIKIKWSGASF